MRKRKKPDRPGTHALIIGVGSYPHLVGGEGVPAPDAHTLGQLTSPPASARAFASWMLAHFNNPERPLASLRLLLSEVPRRSPRFPTRLPSSKEVAFEMFDNATIDLVDGVVDKWFDDGDTHDDNQLIFYFCGHGLGRNPMLSLLASDFGANRGQQFDGAIDFYNFRNAMNRCRAQYQCFFIDACQTNNISIMRSRYAGRPLRDPDGWIDKKLQPTYYATYAGNVASGVRNQVSYFTSALLDGLKGRGGDRSQGDWRVTTTMLQKAVTAYLKRNNLRQRGTADDIDDHCLHWLEATPDVPVTVECKPPLELSKVSLSCTASDTQVRKTRSPNPTSWSLDLPAGSYVFTAKKDRRTVAERQEFVAPPEQKVPLGGKR